MSESFAKATKGKAKSSKSKSKSKSKAPSMKVMMKNEAMQQRGYKGDGGY
jgi:hypothetical protein